MSVPTAKKIGGSIKTLVGSSFYLECDAGGIPRPEVTWKKDNLPIFSSKRIKVSEKRVKVLGTMMSDTGWYSCIASNGVGTAKRSTFIQLLGKVFPSIVKCVLRIAHIRNMHALKTPLSRYRVICLRWVSVLERSRHRRGDCIREMSELERCLY